MRKYKICYNRRFNKELDDFFTNSQFIEVEAENEKQAYQFAYNEIISNSHTEDFDDLDLLNCEEIN